MDVLVSRWNILKSSSKDADHTPPWGHGPQSAAATTRQYLDRTPPSRKHSQSVVCHDLPLGRHRASSTVDVAHLQTSSRRSIEGRSSYKDFTTGESIFILPEGKKHSLGGISNSSRTWGHPPSSSIFSSPVAPVGKDVTNTKLDKKRIRIVIAIVFAAAGIALLTAYLMWHRPTQKTFNVCRTHSCIYYSGLLIDSLNRSSDPCQDFYRHVCDGWIAKEDSSVYGEKQLVGMMNRVAQSLIRATVPNSKQSPAQKASRLFQSCKNPGSGNDREEVRELQKALYAAGVEWPKPSLNPDILKSMVRLRLTLSLVTLLVISITKEENQTVGLVSSSSVLSYMKRKRDQLIKHGEHQGYFNSFRSVFSPPNDNDAQTYPQFVEIEAAVFARLLDSKNETRFATSDDMLTEWSPKISMQRWTAFFHREMNVTDQKPLNITATSVKTIQSFSGLLNASGEQSVHLYLGWAAIQQAAPYVSRRLAEMTLGGAKIADKMRTLLCLHFADTLLGWVVYLPFLEGEVREYPKRLTDVQGVMKSLSTAIATKANETDYIKNAVNRLPVEIVFSYIDMSKRMDELEAMFAEIPDMSTKLVANWLSVVKSNTNPLDESSYIYENMHSMTYETFNVNATSLYLTPLALSLPLYDLHAIRGVKYGTLGYLIAVTLSKIVVVATQEEENSGSQFANTSCITGGPRSTMQTEILARTIALSFLMAAFNAAMGASANENRLPSLETYSERQTMFLVACFLLCNKHSKQARDLCNEPLRKSTVFRRVFACGKDTAMYGTDTCSFFDR